jgi:hypothetical protein
MKKNTVFILTLILLLALSTLGFADTVQIGTGTATTSYLPINGLYGYTYSQQIYLQTQINKSGNITKLRFFYVSGTITNSKDWVIYMGHTTKTSFSSTTDWELFANLVQVFAGDVSSYLPAANNWMEIPLDNPFEYNNEANLVIAVDENTSGYGSMSWGAFTSGDNTGIYYRSDSENPDPDSPPTAYSRTGTINRIQLVFTNTSAPLAPTLLYPSNGAWAFTNEVLSWAPTMGAGDTNFYDVYLGTSADLSDLDLVSSNLTVTTYTPTPTLAAGTTYYWKVVAKNEIGSTASDIWSFKTPTATQLAESFENTDFPPLGWARTTPSTSYWTRSTSSSTHGIACMYAYTSTSTVYDISTPKCTITSGSTLNFSTMATSTSQKLQILYSTDRINWTKIGADITYATANVWYNISIDLSDYAGEKYLAFRSPAQTSGYYSIYVDAVFGPEITQAPPDPAVLVYPADGGWAFLDDTLSWTSGGGIVNGYNLYISDNDIVDDSDFIIDQTGTTYKLSDLEDLVIEYGHTYYWKVVPYNNNGPAEGCPVWSFTTPTATQLAESFTVSVPPTGWTAPATSWVRDTSTYYSAPASAKCGYTSGTTWWLVTPKLSPTAENHTLSFMYRDYSSGSSYDYTTEYTYVLVSTTTDFTDAVPIWTGDYLIFTTEWQQANLDLNAYIDTNIYIAFKHIATGGNYRYIDNVFGPEITPEAPEAPTLVSPADEAVNVSITPTFSWTAATTGGVPDGFKIYCGNPIDYDNPIATVSKTTTSYTIPGTNALEYNTTYYWTVSAYKEGFDEARAIERSFTTMEDPTIYDFPYTAGDFETGALPLNWVATEAVSGSSVHWAAKSGSTSHGITQAHSGTYYGWLNCYLASQTYNPYYLITAPIDLSATDNPKRLNYWYWIGTSSFPATADNPLCVDISTNNQESWTTIYSHSKTENLSNWYQNIVDLTDYNDDIVYLRFRAYSSYSYGETDMGLDDIRVEEIPTGPVLECTPTSLDFGEVAFGVLVGPKKVTVTNTGIGVLALNQDNTQIIGTGFAIDDFDFSLEANESGQINVYSNAAEEGLFTATLRITYGEQQCDVALSATGLSEGIIVIGTGTEELGLPIDPYYGYSYSQSIFLQSDIHLANRNIEKIYYYWNGAGAATNSNVWTVYMGNTDKTAFDSTSDWIPIGNLTQVFSGVVDLPAVEGWVEITLDPPFYHNDTNLVIAVDENIYGYDSYPNVYFYCTSVETKGNRSILYRNDYTNPDPTLPPAGTLVTGYPNIKLEFEEAPPPLPVELTSFTVIVSSENMVQISWVTQTETEMLGYYIYRSTSETLDDNALLVSDMIEALNITEQHTYTFTDSEIVDSGTYYYWLQTVDLGGTCNFHGPVSVVYTNAADNPIPEIPKVTELRSIYPNPFNPVAYIPYSLAEESDAHFYVYNVKGQLLRHIYVGSQQPGYYQISWNGKDANGKACGSGVYYIIMKAGKQTFQRKAVLMK